MPNPCALIVDDEPDILELLDITLGRMGVDTYKAGDIKEAQTHLTTHSFELCLTDMKLPDGNGMELVRHIKEHYPDLPVAMITAFGSMDTAIDALKAGAFDFVSKPIELPRLRDMVQQALKVAPISAADTDKTQVCLLGESRPIKQLRSQIKKVAATQAPIYISGESGSGKELVARLIHDLGPRADQPFVPVNCGAIPSELMESELFGHRKGSFTGAVSDKEGLFQAAQGGTLFLDEVADLPLQMQVKLLRAIQEKSIRPVGAQQETPIDVRIISATHKNLSEEVKQGRFRQDMYYRINVIELPVPSLRERRDDIPLLANHFLGKANADASPVTLSDNALERLTSYAYPGNVRELENILERAYTLCEGSHIEADDLQLRSTQPSGAGSANALDATGTSVADIDSLDDYLEDIEKQAIIKALEETRWNRTAAAEKLGISFRQMRHRLKKLGIE